MRFAAALGAELRRLGPLGSEGEGSTPPEMVPRPDALPEPHGTELPSFLRDRAHARDEIVARDVSNLAPDPAPRELLPLVPAPPSSLHSGPTEDDQRAESRGQRVGTGTAEMDLSAAMAAAKKSLTPFVRSESAAGHAPGGVAGDVDLTRMPLEVYAAISGALARGEAREEVLRRYGVNAEVFGKLASGWAPRFEREPHLYARFVELARRPPSTSGG